MPSSLSEPLNTAQRQAALIAINTRWLEQAYDLVARLDDRLYSTAPAGFAPMRVGAHLRHILEFYQCFLNGIENFHVDYDSRRRDLAIEQSRSTAMSATQAVMTRLRTSPELRGDCTIWVRMEDAGAAPEPYLTSTIARELQVLSNHTIHHFAMIAVTLRLHGVAVDADFGVAPSTLRYWSSQTAMAEAA